MTPALRRELVAWAQEASQLTERRACRATGVARSTVTYRSRRPSQAPLRDRLRELAMLHQEGILSDDEFASAKAKMINGL